MSQEPYISVPANASLMVAFCTSVMILIFISRDMVCTRTSSARPNRLRSSNVLTVLSSDAGSSNVSFLTAAADAAGSRSCVERLNDLTGIGAIALHCRVVEIRLNRVEQIREGELAASRKTEDIEAEPRLDRFNMVMRRYG